MLTSFFSHSATSSLSSSFPIRRTGAMIRARRGRSGSARLRFQRGFSLIEISIVGAIILLLSMVAVPMIGNYITENKVPKVGDELLRFMVRMRVGASGITDLPYAGVNNSVLVNALKDSGVVRVSGEGATGVVKHGLGGSGAKTSGTVTIAPASLGSAGNGSAFQLSLNDVSHAACPGLVSILQQAASVITVASGKTSGEVKNATASPPVIYNPLRAEALCQAGDVNSFVFVVQ